MDDAKVNYRPKSVGADSIFCRSQMTLPSRRSFFFQYVSHDVASRNRLRMIQAILAAPFGLQPCARRLRRRAISRISRSIRLAARGETRPVASHRLTGQRTGR